MQDLFISYAREDREWVERLCGLLQAQGLTIWKDSSIPTGHAFGRAIEQAIADSRVVLVVWSRYSVESDWVRAEAMEGLRRGILMPVLIDRSEPPLRYRTIQTIKLSDWSFTEDHQGFQRLISEINGLIKSEPQPQIPEPSGADPTDPVAGKAWGRFVIPLIFIVLIAGSGIATWFWMDADQHRQRSLELASFSDTTLLALERAHQGSRLYWGYFLDLPAGQAMVERAVLLALEAIRNTPTAQALKSLKSGLVLLNRPLKQERSESSAISGAVARSGTEVVWSGGNEINLWRPAGDEGSIRFDNDERVGHLRFMPDAHHLLVAGVMGSVNLWNWSTGERRPVVASRGEQLLGIALDEAGSTMAIRQAGLIGVWKLGTGKQLAAIGSGRAPALDTGQSLDLSADGRYLAFASGNSIRGWNLAENQQIFQIDFEDRVAGLRFDPSGETLSGASNRGEIKIIDTRYGDVKQAFQGPAARITRFDPAGSWVARAAGSRVVLAAATDQQRPILDYHHGDRVTDIGFSHDGAMLASAGQDGMVRVWDIPAAREQVRLGLKAKVITLGFTGDDSSLVTVAGNGEVAVWPVRFDDPVAAACHRLARDLTIEEWRRFLPDEPYRESCPDLQSHR